jgi:glycosyltransferase involved in cell wall biosynthesis
MKLLRVTTADISLNGLLKGQLRYLSTYYEVVGVAANTGRLEQVGEREGIRVIDIPMHREISLSADLKCLWSLYKLFRKERPEIVHTNTPKASLLGMVAGMLARVPHRLYLVTGLRYQGTSGLMRFILMSMERITCLCATKVIPEGNGVKKALITDHITRKPLEVIHNGNINGIDSDYFSTNAVPSSRNEIRNQLLLKENDFAFIFIGRIVRDKGMNELANVMRSLAQTHPQCKLILVGRFETELDPLAEGNEAFFKHNSNVRFVGYQSDVRPYLLAADALVFPSYREGFPNVVLQAGAMGLPAIVTDINGCNEIITEGINGTIIPPRDEEALKRAMITFIEEPEKVHNMATKARPLITSRYEQRDVWEALRKMYESL